MIHVAEFSRNFLIECERRHPCRLRRQLGAANQCGKGGTIASIMSVGCTVSLFGARMLTCSGERNPKHRVVRFDASRARVAEMPM